MHTLVDDESCKFSQESENVIDGRFKWQSSQTDTIALRRSDGHDGLRQEDGLGSWGQGELGQQLGVELGLEVRLLDELDGRGIQAQTGVKAAV